MKKLVKRVMLWYNQYSRFYAFCIFFSLRGLRRRSVLACFSHQPGHGVPDPDRGGLREPFWDCLVSGRTSFPGFRGRVSNATRDDIRTPCLPHALASCQFSFFPGDNRSPSRRFCPPGTLRVISLSN